MSLYYCLVSKMANAVVLWVFVYFCVTSVNTKDTTHSKQCRVLHRSEKNSIYYRCILIYKNAFFTLILII